MALNISGVVCGYGSGTPMATRVLDGVSLEVERGQLVTVLGPTGSGKTTLLRVAAGLLKPLEGSVEADGKPVAGPDSVRGAVGLVFQRPESQFFALSVEDDCAFGPRNLGRSATDALADAHAALAAVGLDPEVFGPREPWALSGGEARRAAIAGVLAMRPRYLLMDEPTAGLDAEGREAVFRAIEAARADAGVLVVTHDPESFLGGADRVLAIEEGRTVFSGDVAGFLEELPGLSLAGVEPPEVPRALLLAARHGARLAGRLTLDPATAADALLESLGRSGGMPA